MKPALRADLKHLETLAFKRSARCGPLVHQLSELRASIARQENAEDLWNVYAWLLVPLSLWPVDFEGLAKHIIRTLQAEDSMAEELRFLLRLLDRPPNQKAQDAVGAFEHLIESGSYDGLLRHKEKFEEQEAELKHCHELADAWKQLAVQFKISEFQNSRGVIRRRMSQERNFREGWEFEWSDDRKRFHVLFDAFCHRWKLYGMQHDRPLLLKLSVNPTPHGTMIVIPGHCNLDPVRDLDWRAIAKLHKAHGARRQGPVFSKARMEKRGQALKAKSLWDEAGKRGLTGEVRYAFVSKGMKRVQGDYTWLKRLLALARKLRVSELPEDSNRR